MAVITVTLPDGSKAQIDDRYIKRTSQPVTQQKTQAARSKGLSTKPVPNNAAQKQPYADGRSASAVMSNQADALDSFDRLNPPERDYTKIAKDVIAGKYGVGEDRKKALGDDYAKVQGIVNQMLTKNKPDNQKPVDTKPAPAAAPKKPANSFGWDDARMSAYDTWSNDSKLSRFRNNLRNQMLYSGKYTGKTPAEFDEAYNNELRNIYNMGSAKGGVTKDMLRTYQGTLGINDISGHGLLDSSLAKSINRSWAPPMTQVIPDGVDPKSFQIGPGGN